MILPSYTGISEIGLKLLLGQGLSHWAGAWCRTGLLNLPRMGPCGAGFCSNQAVTHPIPLIDHSRLCYRLVESGVYLLGWDKSLHHTAPFGGRSSIPDICRDWMWSMRVLIGWESSRVTCDWTHHRAVRRVWAQHSALCRLLWSHQTPVAQI